MIPLETCLLSLVLNCSGRFDFEIFCLFVWMSFFVVVVFILFFVNNDKIQDIEQYTAYKRGRQVPSALSRS